MKFLAAVLGCVLGAGILLMAGPEAARADSRVSPATSSAPADVRSPLPAQPGTDAEAREYERREAESPEVQDFAGGVLVIGFVALLIIILIVVLLFGN